MFRRPTYKAFIGLLDNYSAETGVEEVVTNEERAEVKQFLKAVMETKPLQYCHKYLCAKQSDIPSDRAGFVQLLHKIWFELYRREESRDSSGFEHVFVGEIKVGSLITDMEFVCAPCCAVHSNVATSLLVARQNGKVSGFHNWIRFYLEEKAGNVDYRGYIKPRGSNEARTNNDDQLLTIQFTWNGVEKSVGSSFIGVSPEFEFALYTLCFLAGDEENEFTLDTGNDTFEVVVKCFKIARGKIGTAFPEIKSHYD